MHLFNGRNEEIDLMRLGDGLTATSSKTVVELIYGANLDYETDYYVVVDAGVQDFAGNALAGDWTSGTFTTVAEGTGSLGVDDIAINEAKRCATAGGGYAQGWEWNISLTVPTNEPRIRLKFGNFGSIPANANVRYFSAQDTEGYVNGDNAITVTGNDYPTTYLIFDANSDTQAGYSGYQVVVTVQVKIPAGTAAGSYAGQFQVESSAL